MQNYPAIPDVTDDDLNHTQVLTALKQNIEMMQGIRGDVVPVVRAFWTAVKPGFSPSPVLLAQIKTSDIWINSGASNKIHIWDNTKKNWVPTT